MTLAVLPDACAEDEAERVQSITARTMTFICSCVMVGDCCDANRPRSDFHHSCLRPARVLRKLHASEQPCGRSDLHTNSLLALNSSANGQSSAISGGILAAFRKCAVKVQGAQRPIIDRFRLQSRGLVFLLVFPIHVQVFSGREER